MYKGVFIDPFLPEEEREAVVKKLYGVHDGNEIQEIQNAVIVILISISTYFFTRLGIVISWFLLLVLR